MNTTVRPSATMSDAGNDTSADTTAIAVIGLGYVGLPLAVAAAQSENGPVVGYDINAERVAALKAGLDHTGQVDEATLKSCGLVLTDDPASLIGAGLYIVTVPTPVDAAKQPDLRPLQAACQTVGEVLGRAPVGAMAPIVVFESTVYPGVTEEICGPALEAASGLRAGRDFFLGYSPERINPGDRFHTIDRIIKVVAGQTPEVADRLAALYGRITCAGVYVARDIRTAEAAKVIENAQRDINIAFINEVAMIFGRLGLSVYDVLEAARTKWNFLDFRPGLVGGHCIGVDPFYLAHCAQALGHDPEIILAGRRINDGMGDYLAGWIANHVASLRPRPGRTPRTLVLGVTFKENLPDLRNSKVIDLVHGLMERGHAVDVHDSWADPAEAAAIYDLTLRPTLPESGAPDGGYDCIVGAVAHDAYRAFTTETFAALLRPGGGIADIKGIWRDVELPAGLHRWQL
ncbi:nucleotide sugar dehydrogenase [Virgifigura deserti]|uniref:nucleotide sugar dehydrogenase n=1 Tax=Virgifigura deserti TaxID=2268457 RepID=UPI003CCB80FD